MESSPLPLQPHTGGTLLFRAGAPPRDGSRPSGAEGPLRSTADLPVVMRRFLLLEEPRLGGCRSGFGMGALFYSLVLPLEDSLTGTAQVMQSIFALCEILAILAGLSVALPISLRAETSSDGVASWETVSSWSGAVNCGATLVTCSLFLCILTACVAALFAALGVRYTGPSAVDYYIVVADILGVGLFWWSLSINLVFAQVGLHVYYTVGHPGPAVAFFVLLELGQGVAFEHFVRRILCEKAPLEMLHVPMWWRLIVAATWPPLTGQLTGDMGRRHLPRARERAATLLRDAGYEVPRSLTDTVFKTFGI